MNGNKLAFRVFAWGVAAVLFVSCSFAGHIEDLYAKVKERHRPQEYTVSFDNNTVRFWVSEDGQILVSNEDIEISGSQSFTAAAAGGYTDIQWLLQGAPYSASESVVFTAANLENGIYRLGVIIYKDSIPYSREISFTVSNN